MAVSSSSFFSNAIVGTPQVGADIDVYGSSTSPKFAVGFGFTRADGSKYRYSHFGAATNRGLCVSTDVSEIQQLYVDNGSIYCSQEITLICARVGCILSHTPVRDGAAKGKIERFFRGLRDRFLSHELDLSSLPLRT